MTASREVWMSRWGLDVTNLLYRLRAKLYGREADTLSLIELGIDRVA